MKRPTRVLIMIIVAGIFGAAGTFLWEQTMTPEKIFDEEYVDVQVFKVPNGWGYEISHRGETIIYQPFIPSINGRVPFATKRQAQIVGRYLVKKIELGRHPAIHSFELDSLGITYGDEK